MWKCRNEAVYEKIPINFYKMNKLLLEIKNSDSAEDISQNSDKHVIMCKWEKPNVEQIALNTDGSSLNNPGDAGIGCVFGDQFGDVLSVVYGYIGITGNNTAELLAIRTGLEHAVKKGFKNTILQTYSSHAIDCIYRTSESAMRSED